MPRHKSPAALYVEAQRLLLENIAAGDFPRARECLSSIEALHVMGVRPPSPSDLARKVLDERGLGKRKGTSR